MGVSTEVWRVRIGGHVTRMACNGLNLRVRVAAVASQKRKERNDVSGMISSGFNVSKIAITLLVLTALLLTLVILTVCLKICVEKRVCEDRIFTEFKPDNVKETRNITVPFYSLNFLIQSLIIGGVELNPGPPTGSAKNQQRNAEDTLTRYLSTPLEERNNVEQHAYFGMRLASFANWTYTKPHGRELAKAGFCYTNDRDFVMCHFCEIKIGNWKTLGSPFQEHQTISPNCSFVRGLPGTNFNLRVPIGAGATSNMFVEGNSSKNDNGNDANINTFTNGASGHTCTSTRTPDSYEAALPQVQRNWPNNHGTVTEELQNMSTSSMIPNISEASSMQQNSPSYQEPTVDEGTERPDRPRSEQEVLVSILQSRITAVGGRTDVQIPFSLSDPSRRHPSTITPSRFESNMLPLQPPRQEARQTFLEPNQQEVLGSAMDVHNQTIGTPFASLFHEGNIETVRPHCQEYASFKTRLDSYFDWPATREQRPRQMADAGFYFLHVQDQVKCFHCNGALNNWVPGDIPWVEHGKWFPRCAYVISSQGQAFVQQVAQGGQPTPLEVNIRADTSNGPRNVLPNEGIVAPTVTNANTVDSLMMAPVILRAVDMGFRPEKLRKAVQNRLQTTGQMFNTIAELVEVLLTMDDVSESPMNVSDPPSSEDEHGNSSVVAPTNGHNGTAAASTTVTQQSGQPKQGKKALEAKKKKVPTATLR